MRLPGFKGLAGDQKWIRTNFFVNYHYKFKKTWNTLLPKSLFLG